MDRNTPVCPECGRKLVGCGDGVYCSQCSWTGDDIRLCPDCDRVLSAMIGASGDVRHEYCEACGWRSDVAEIDREIEMYERVDHPEHYNLVPGVECIDVAKHFNFCLGSAIKYLFRAGSKPGASTTEDLQKAIRYIEFEIERLDGVESMPDQ